MIPDEIIIRQREDGTWEEHKPYMTVEFETEEDFKYFEKVLEDHKRMQWIPCSERLPEENGRYLCSSDKGRMEVYDFANNLHKVDTYDFIGKRRPGFYGYSSEWGFYEADWIIAWMPLPLPYKESED